MNTIDTSESLVEFKCCVNKGATADLLMDGTSTTVGASRVDDVALTSTVLNDDTIAVFDVTSRASEVCISVDTREAMFTEVPETLLIDVIGEELLVSLTDEITTGENDPTILSSAVTFTDSDGVGWV